MTRSWPSCNQTPTPLNLVPPEDIADMGVDYDGNFVCSGVITSNGARVHDLDGNLIFAHNLDRDIASDLFGVVNDNPDMLDHINQIVVSTHAVGTGAHGETVRHAGNDIRSPSWQSQQERGLQSRHISGLSSEQRSAAREHLSEHRELRRR